MPTLFTIETDHARVTWSAALVRPQDGLGKLLVRAQSASAKSSIRTSAGAIALKASDAGVGPKVLEQHDYRVQARGLQGRSVRLEHRDPNIISRFDEDETERVDSLVNFKSQVGLSTFRVLVDEKPEFEFDVEVFPTKLDYEADYRDIVSDVQETVSALAFEYLRATWQTAREVHTQDLSNIEWLTQLRNLSNAIERAILHIAARPVRGLVRQGDLRRADQVRHLDSGMRSYIRKNAHRMLEAPGDALPIPPKLTERRATPTLDTHEHRWLAAQVVGIRRRLAAILSVERTRQQDRPSARRQRIIAELTELERRSSRWSRTEPLAAAGGRAPPGFSSLQLQSAPGYHEATSSLLRLALGLRIDAGPQTLALKDLHQLYEFWCYFLVLRIVAQETGSPLNPASLIKHRHSGLSVEVAKGSESTQRFPMRDGRTITVRYNPRLDEGALVAQKPDLLLTLEGQDWPKMHLVLDAKYRVDSTDEYIKRYRTEGPPEDALNAMHRYRDAIFDEQHDAPRRTVVQAVALFPSRPDSIKFVEGRLWQSLQRMGVGAIPLLPGNEELLRSWIRSWLSHGGWAMADSAIDHVAIERSRALRQAAAEPVLVGALRGQDPAGHLEWIRNTRQYYVPLSKGQPRQFATKQVVFYEPASLHSDSIGRVETSAAVRDCRVVRRADIKTPWPSQRVGEFVLYELDELTPLVHPLLSRTVDGTAQRMGSHRWTSRLGLSRARTITELLLESEPEWRLYEELKANGIAFTLRALGPQLGNPEQLRARVSFEIGVFRSRWSGVTHFEVERGSAKPTLFPSAAAVVAHLVAQAAKK